MECVGVKADLRFNFAGETGSDFVRVLCEGRNWNRSIGGEAVLRVYDRWVIFFHALLALKIVSDIRLDYHSNPPQP